VSNKLGDVELDAKGMRALAHPVRLAILRRLREGGPSTATALSTHVGASPSVTSWHLRHLAAHGLVEDAPSDGRGRKRWWQAVGRGFRFSPDPDDVQAAVLLAEALESFEGDLVGEWMKHVRPTLEPQWLAVASRWSTTIVASPDELGALEAAIEDLLAPLVARNPDDAPAGARAVRLLRYTLPSGPAVSDS
jgi:DNA-binding transcriptional ArsR family regulator